MSSFIWIQENKKCLHVIVYEIVKIPDFELSKSFGAHS